MSTTKRGMIFYLSLNIFILIAIIWNYEVHILLFSSCIILLLLLKYWVKRLLQCSSSSNVSLSFLVYWLIDYFDLWVMRLCHWHVTHITSTIIAFWPSSLMVRALHLLLLLCVFIYRLLSELSSGPLEFKVSWKCSLRLLLFLLLLSW